MEEVIEGIKEGILATSPLEWAAVLISTCYVLLIALKIKWGWVLAFVSTSIYLYLAFIVDLYIQSGLQLFYLFMAVYGWISWNRATSNQNFIVRWPIKRHILNILISTLIALMLGYVMSQFTSQKNPYLDAVTTVFSLSATFMSTYRVLENWLYWIVVDTALIFLFVGRGYYLIGIHFLIYTIIATFAFFTWYKTYKKQIN